MTVSWHIPIQSGKSSPASCYHSITHCRFLLSASLFPTKESVTRFNPITRNSFDRALNCYDHNQSNRMTAWDYSCKARTKIPRQHAPKWAYFAYFVCIMLLWTLTIAQNHMEKSAMPSLTISETSVIILIYFNEKANLRHEPSPKRRGFRSATVSR